ncbi:D-alanine--poly(phosphoribitol) ligase [Paenibacillus sambharensis]|uniref:D-alanine--poly(Phosphoribitol) ligase n=1 Tax=Paenibacillus sambharensis TaxID=1803190 RepID=A0A2W1LZ62_9BACL|nr:amino acid adenylation domain-containing protein [Paenibacillus sambharensis]PZD96797.1 D-alanine--poly(phosphoribitol) ligase [Paenibacillus sambharensis]
MQTKFPSATPRLEDGFDGGIERLHHGFLRSVRQHPANLALTVREQEWTYQMLDDTARRWAAVLSQQTGGQDKRTGIFSYRSEASYVGVLASLYAGHTFVPLNPTFPAARTKMMIERAELDALIVDKASLKPLRELLRLGATLPRLVLLTDADSEELLEVPADVADRSALMQTEPLNELPVVPADSAAYLLFTSGSTGVPKGVPITHRNVTHFLTVTQDRYQITSSDRLTQTFDQTFDLSVFDLFMAWSNGAAVCSIQPIELLSPIQFIQKQGITVWFSVPSVAALIRKQNLLHKGCMPGLRLSLFCGEALPQSTAQLWQEAAPDSVVENLYGPTELTIACASYQWDPSRSPLECVNGVVPIGSLFNGLKFGILDESGDLKSDLDKGGELCVSGPQMFPGYWRDPKQTALKQLEAVDDAGIVVTYYRTGDRVRMLSNGILAYLGRMDDQIQVQGYRVELSEIEGVLSGEPGVILSAAVGWPLEEGSAKGICAFIVGREVDLNGLAAAAGRKLPSYMVPRRFYSLEQMPLNANGKIDRKALLAILAAQEVGER